MEFVWDSAKNERLLSERGIGFEQVVEAYVAGNFSAISMHSNQAKYPGQYMMVIEIDDYLCRVPFVWKDASTALLKTIYPRSPSDLGPRTTAIPK